MKNDETPDDSGLPWNTDDVVFGGISCKQLSRLCTCFVSALRMSNAEAKEHGVKGQMNLARLLIEQQLDLANSENLTQEEKDTIQENLVVGFQAVCLAGIFSINQIDARRMADVMVSTIQIVHKLTETTGPVGPDDEVIIQIRKGEEAYGEERIEMGVRLESSVDMLEQMDDGVGKEIKKIVEPPRNDFLPGEQGPN